MAYQALPEAGGLLEQDEYTMQAMNIAARAHQLYEKALGKYDPDDHKLRQFIYNQQQ